MSQVVAAGQREDEAPAARRADPPSRVDVIVPMHAAAGTIEATLRCLQAQTLREWRALVVDNGGADGAAELVARIAAADPRVQLLAEPRPGVSHARNAGLASAGAEWVLFLDADDLVAPTHLQHLLVRAEARPHADVVVSGVARSTPDGRIWGQSIPDLADPLDTFGQMAALFPIHCALWRRRRIEAEHGFDTRLASSEDWDLWIRLARGGLEAAVSPEVTCFYVARPGSLSMRPQALDAALEVVRRAHRPDPQRPAAPVRPLFDLPRVELNLILWAAARSVATGEPFASALERLGDPPVCGFDFAHVADVMLDGLTVGAGAPPEGLRAAWPALAPRLQALFEALSARMGWARLFQSCHWALWERIGGGGALQPEPRTPGVVFLAQDLARPFADAPASAQAECLVLALHLSGHRAAITSAPLFAPGVPAGELARLAAQALEGVSARAVLRRAGIAAQPGFWRAALSAAGDVRGAGLLRGGAAALWRERARYILRRAVAEGLLGRAKGDPGFAQAFAEAKARLVEKAHWRGPAQRFAAAQGAPPAEQQPEFWESFFQAEDPWEYDNPYETRKYAETLELLPRANSGRVLELACAEGHFTARLRAAAGALLATDISGTAVERAKARCAGAQNVSFGVLNVLTDPVPQGFDAVFCSEFLYYLPPQQLGAVTAKVRDAVRAGGVVIHAHALTLHDVRNATAFDWDLPSNFTDIARAFAQTPGLVLRREIATELYRVQLYERSDAQGAAPVREFRPLDQPLPTVIAKKIVPGGAVARRSEVAWQERAVRVPVLMYHRVTDAPHPGLAQFAVTPAQLEQHLLLLRRHGFHAISTRALADALAAGRSLPGRPVLLTFDDGYVDFLEAAVPLLQRADFTAVVFVPPGASAAEWDRARGEAAPLMTPAQVCAARAAGMEIGSHGFSHHGLTRLERAALYEEAAASRGALQALLGEEVASIAYPFGDADAYVQEACAQAGYRIGFSTRHAFASLRSNPMAVERLEVTGSTDAAKLAAMLGLSAPD